MSSHDVCSRCETNYVAQDDARCGICEECETVLDEEADARMNRKSASVVLAVDPSWSTPQSPAVLSRIPPEEQQ